MLTAEKVTRQNTDPPSWRAVLNDGRVLRIEQAHGLVGLVDESDDDADVLAVPLAGDGVLDYCELRVALEGVMALPEVEE